MEPYFALDKCTVEIDHRYVDELIETVRSFPPVLGPAGIDYDRHAFVGYDAGIYIYEIFLSSEQRLIIGLKHYNKFKITKKDDY